MEDGRGNVEWVREGMNELALESSRWRGRDMLLRTVLMKVGGPTGSAN